MANDARRRILVATLGGTIASTGDAGVVPRLDARDLIDAVPGLSSEAHLETLGFRQLPSGDLTLSDLLDLVGALRASSVEGVVVTQGTDTIEETAFALDLLWDDPRPLVVTGAMRPPARPGSDGPGNLLAAVRVASSDASRERGALVVMNDEVHAARFVRKSHTTDPGAFDSPSLGPIGRVVEDRVHFLASLSPVAHVATSSAARVALVGIGPGDDAHVLAGVVERGDDGAVLEALGAGHVPARMVEAIADLATRVPVVLASRVGAGPVLTATYGYPGSEIDLLARGVVGAGWLDARKARVALALALGAGGDCAQALARFARVRDSLTS